MIDFSRLFDPAFIFNPALGTLSPAFAKFFYFFLGTLLIAALASHLIMRIQEKKKNTPLKIMWRKLSNFFLVMGVFGFVLFFFRQQKAYWISMPFFAYLWFISGLVWLGFIMRWSQTKKKKLQTEILERQEKEKYLP